MKKTLYLLISLLSLIGQTKAQKTRLGFTVGTTIANYKTTVESISITSKSKMGITAGITTSIPLGEKFSFQPGLHFVQKGGAYKEEGYKDWLTLNYLELPLNIIYKMNTQRGSAFIGAGPSLSMGISGRNKWEMGDEKGNEKVKFGSDNDKDFKAAEAGLNFITGYHFTSGIFVAANYNTGLSNLLHNEESFDGKLKTRYIGVRIGFML
jgi:hypothetical protein